MEDKSKLKENKTGYQDFLEGRAKDEPITDKTGKVIDKPTAAEIEDFYRRKEGEQKTYTKDAFGNRVEDVEQPLPLIEPDPTIDRSRWTKRQIQDELDRIAEENAAIKAEAAKNYTTYSTVTNNINTADDDVAQLLAKLAVACSETVNGEAQQQRFLAIAERARELAGEPSLFAAPATAAALLAPRPEPTVVKVGRRVDTEGRQIDPLTGKPVEPKSDFWGAPVAKEDVPPQGRPLDINDPLNPMNPVNLEPKDPLPPI